MSEIAKVIETTEVRFNEVKPQYLNYDAEKGFAIQILRNNSYLMGVAEKNPTSLQQAITNVAAIGLSLNPAEKLAYLIPRNVKVGKNQWQSKVFLEPSYIGLCKLATDSGSIEWIQARCVYQNDQFVDNGLGEKPTHTYNAFSKDRGEFVGVYCVAKTKTGDYLTTIMDADKVLDIRGRSESWKKKPNSGVWQTDFEEQAKKTVVRNASKMWPKTNLRLLNAINLSNENEGFDKLEVTEPTITESSQHQKGYFDQLIEQGDALGMYLLKRSLTTKDDKGINIWTNLVHSFPKGQKGKYGDIVMGLTQKGESIYIDCIETIKDGIDKNDPSAIAEIIEDATDDFMQAIESDLKVEQIAIFNELKAA